MLVFGSQQMYKMVTMHVEIDDRIHKYKESYISYYTPTFYIAIKIHSNCGRKAIQEYVKFNCF